MNNITYEKLEHLQPIPAPARIEQQAYSTIRQGTSTNALTKFRAITGQTATIDSVTGTATIKQHRCMRMSKPMDRNNRNLTLLTMSCKTTINS